MDNAPATQTTELQLIDEILAAPDMTALDRIPLTPQRYINLRSAKKSDAEIGRLTGRSRQAVNEWKHNHINELVHLLDDNDNSLKQSVRLNAHKANELLNISLNALDLSTPEKAAKHLVPLNIVAGTQTQRLNELNGRVGNTVIQVQTVVTDAQSRLQSIEHQQAAIADRLKLIK